MANIYEVDRAIQHYDGRGCEFVVVVRDENDPTIPGHGETVYCKTDHEHSKGCAAALMKVPTVTGQEARKGADGKTVLDAKSKPIMDPVLGKTPMEICEAYISTVKNLRKSEHLELPTKKGADAEGNEIDVPDKGISLA